MKSLGSIFCSFTVAATLLSGCGDASSTSSELSVVVGEDNMQMVKTDLSNLPQTLQGAVQAVGIMTGDCTAFHIGQGVVATAGHCLPTPNSKVGFIGATEPCQAISVRWGYVEEANPTSVSRCIRILDRVQDATRDYGFFQVDPAPEAVVAVDTALNFADSSRSIGILGHPRGKGLHFSTDCRLAKDQSGHHNFTHQCDTLEGHSGSPVFDLNSGKVVGIHDGGEGEWNYGTFLNQAGILKFMAAHSTESMPASWPTQQSTYNYGPFENNEQRLITVFSSAQGKMVNFDLQYHTEQTYDEIRIADGSGRIQSVSGDGTRTFKNLPTPVTVAIYSDYANPSQGIVLQGVTFQK